AAAGAEAKAVARRQRRLGGRAAGAELLGEGRVAQQALALVPVRETADEHAVLDQIGATRRQPFARDSLRAHQAGPGAVVVEAQVPGGDRPAELAEKRRARRVERARGAGGDRDVVEKMRYGLPAENGGVGARRHARAADPVDR